MYRFIYLYLDFEWILKSNGPLDLWANSLIIYDLKGSEWNI